MYIMICTANLITHDVLGSKPFKYDVRLSWQLTLIKPSWAIHRISGWLKFTDVSQAISVPNIRAMMWLNIQTIPPTTHAHSPRACLWLWAWPVGRVRCLFCLALFLDRWIPILLEHISHQIPGPEESKTSQIKVFWILMLCIAVG